MARCRSVLIIVVAVCLCGAGVRPGQADPIVDCRQIVVVETETWDSVRGVLRGFRLADRSWEIDLRDIPVALGRNGLGVGEGLHRAGLSGPGKREGDKRAPAGIFPLEYSFGTVPRPRGGNRTFAYHRTEEFHFWVDDPKSRYYNRWIDMRDPQVQKDWQSAEILARADGLYDLAIVVGHNRQRFLPGRGSAIFIHRWSRPGNPTIGCTALDPGDLLRLWKWLDGSRNPIIVQGPKEWIRQLRVPSGFSFD